MLPQGEANHSAIPQKLQPYGGKGKSMIRSSAPTRMRKVEIINFQHVLKYYLFFGSRKFKCKCNNKYNCSYKCKCPYKSKCPYYPNKFKCLFKV
ncbi:conserved hypothetical protein [Ricinus communis]|uniref:Uncharacterized protein n=1 Tax=Ricinus communis TaxID=3988 RepID=B9T5H1_RICCO|nr:conserved hypothetical protein [Ricinus communis]